VRTNEKKRVDLSSDQDMRVNTSSAVFEGVLKKVINGVNSIQIIKGQSHKRYYVLDLKKLTLM
jgi:hypothetical protein